MQTYSPSMLSQTDEDIDTVPKSVENAYEHNELPKDRNLRLEITSLLLVRDVHVRYELFE